MILRLDVIVFGVLTLCIAQCPGRRCDDDDEGGGCDGESDDAKQQELVSDARLGGGAGGGGCRLLDPITVLSARPPACPEQ